MPKKIDVNFSSGKNYASFKVGCYKISNIKKIVLKNEAVF